MIKLQKQKMNIELEAASVIHSTAESSIFSVKKKLQRRNMKKGCGIELYEQNVMTLSVLKSLIY